MVLTNLVTGFTCKNIRYHILSVSDTCTITLPVVVSSYSAASVPLWVILDFHRLSQSSLTSMKVLLTGATGAGQFFNPYLVTR